MKRGSENVFDRWQRDDVSDGGVSANVTSDDDGPAAITTPVGTYYYHYDQRADVTALSGLSGELAATYTYTPYGTQTSSGGTTLLAVNPFTFDGQEGVTYFRALGLYNMQARWYDPTQHRFLSPDSQAAQPTEDDAPYSYTASNPINQTDPTGQLALNVNTRKLTSAIQTTLQQTTPPPVTPITPQLGLTQQATFAPPPTQPVSNRYQYPRTPPPYQGAYTNQLANNTDNPRLGEIQMAESSADDGLQERGKKTQCRHCRTCEASAISIHWDPIYAFWNMNIGGDGYDLNECCGGGQEAWYFALHWRDGRGYGHIFGQHGPVVVMGVIFEKHCK